MTTTTKYIEVLVNRVRAAVWKHLNTRRDNPGKSLEPMPPEAREWLSAGTGGGAAPQWLRDAMLDGAKAQLAWDWEEPTKPIGDPGGETVKLSAEPKPNTSTTATSERDTFAEWAEHAMMTCLNEDILNDGSGKLRALPTDVQKWLNNSPSAPAPTTVLDWVAQALDDLNWDDGQVPPP